MTRRKIFDVEQLASYHDYWLDDSHDKPYGNQRKRLGPEIYDRGKKILNEIIKQKPKCIILHCKKRKKKKRP